MLDLEGVDFIDSQGAAKLTEIHEVAEADGVTLRLARVKPQVLAVLDADGLVAGSAPTTSTATSTGRSRRSSPRTPDLAATLERASSSSDKRCRWFLVLLRVVYPTNEDPD